LTEHKNKFTFIPPITAVLKCITVLYPENITHTRVVPEVPDLTKKKKHFGKNVFISLHSLLLARYSFPSDVQ
jgi:hypothetical protein